MKPQTITDEQTAVSVAQVARRLDVSTQSVRKSIKRGELEHFLFGHKVLVTVASLDQLIARRIEEARANEAVEA